MWSNGFNAETEKGHDQDGGHHRGARMSAVLPVVRAHVQIFWRTRTAHERQAWEDEWQGSFDRIDGDASGRAQVLVPSFDGSFDQDADAS